MNFIDRIKSELEVQAAARELCHDALKKMPQGRLITKCRSNSNPEHYLRLSASVPLQYLGSNDKDLIKLLQRFILMIKGLHHLLVSYHLLDQSRLLTSGF